MYIHFSSLQVFSFLTPLNTLLKLYVSETVAFYHMIFKNNSAFGINLVQRSSDNNISDIEVFLLKLTEIDSKLTIGHLVLFMKIILDDVDTYVMFTVGLRKESEPQRSFCQLI